MLHLTAAATPPFSSPLNLLRRNPNPRLSKLLSSSTPTLYSNPDPNQQPVRANNAGVRLEESVEIGSGKARIDAWITSRIRGVSRARIQCSIRSGLVTVNGRTIDKVSHIVKEGDRISCTVSELQPLRAEPEDIPLNIVYEDAHVLVVNKPVHMVVHPAPGNANGTLVNAVLNHCRLPSVACINNKRSIETVEYIESSDDEIEDFFIDQSSMEEFNSVNNESLVRPGIVHRLDKGTSGLLVIAKVVHPAPGNANGTLVNAVLNHCRLPSVACINNKRSIETVEYIESSDDEIEDFFIDQSSMEEFNSVNNESLVRPGIVHRLDKGTSGLLVIAKDEHSHSHLANQFKQHTIHRVYISLTSGVPDPTSGRIDIPIARDPNNRIRMAAISGMKNSRHARHAASRYKVVESFADAGSALVRWRLETGRTHQIRAHAKYLGVPLLGDELYGGSKSLALSLLRPRIPSSNHGHLSRLISGLQRPCLHALSLGFIHPHSGEYLRFSCPPPEDFGEVLNWLRSVSGRTESRSDVEL